MFPTNSANMYDHADMNQEWVMNSQARGFQHEPQYSEGPAQEVAPFSRVMSSQNAPCVPQQLQQQSMSLASSSSGGARWLVRSCRACGDVVAGPSVDCSWCRCSVHSHCVVRRAGLPLVCTTCASEYDFARGQHIAQQRMMSASVGFGRVAGASGQLLGQAAGSVVTGAVGA